MVCCKGIYISDILNQNLESAKAHYSFGGTLCLEKVKNLKATFSSLCKG